MVGTAFADPDRPRRKNRANEVAKNALDILDDYVDALQRKRIRNYSRGLPELDQVSGMISKIRKELELK